MGDIRKAIMHGAAAGKLRAYVRENGGGLDGLEKLADHLSELSAARLDEVVGERQELGSAPPRSPQ